MLTHYMLYPGQNFYVTLFGLKSNEGTIELSNGVDWHILCSDGWDDADAAVACRMLGHSGNGARAMSNTIITGQAHTIWWFQFHCKGDENVLSECEISYLSSLTCKRAGVHCSEEKVVPDFFLKATRKGISKTNPFTMSGYVNLNNPCRNDFNKDVVYDSVYDQFMYFKSGSLFGCRWDDKDVEIRKNTSVLSYPALDSDDRLLFGYLDNDIVSLRLDDAASEFVVVVPGTSVGTELVLDTERNEIYWWRPYFHNVIKRVRYNGDAEIDFWRSSSYFKMFTFNGDNIFSIDSRYRGITRIHHNTTVADVLYSHYGVMDDCGKLYADHEWIYCIGYKNMNILRLQKDGKGSSSYGQSESGILYHYSPKSSCKTLFCSCLRYKPVYHTSSFPLFCSHYS
ncbi:uncharacterized protein LOC110464225 [Mizuhopecten yessoensis]|uniref:uncharacterized protein LOC110464225 n=1 Tax=Mizuhopecten yessoensis TaxID=6573 RepID=UPI000B45AE06|nr:uncharacterized protein LOC110464225 [Mizuhopecten yessoensis]